MEWLASITTTGLLAAALWFGRHLIIARLKSSVQHEFDTKLESIRSDLRKSEEVFRAELRAKESQIANLQSGALTALASRQAALDKRRLQAVDQIWSAITKLSPAKAAANFMGPIKFEASAKEAERNPQFRQMFAALSTSVDDYKDVNVTASKARPYITEVAWSLYYAYLSIGMFAVLKLHMLKAGLNIPKALDSAAVTKLVAAALPHYSKILEEYGDRAYHLLLDELETRLMQELRRMLQGIESDKASLAQAADIIKESERLMGTIASAGPR